MVAWSPAGAVAREEVCSYEAGGGVFRTGSGVGATGAGAG